MLATGIRTPVGIKIFGPDLAELERLGKEVEQAVQTVPGTRSAFAERAVSGYYLDIDIDRAAAARHGLNVGDVQTVIATAIGGMTITQTVEGRERYGVRDPLPAGAARHTGEVGVGADPDSPRPSAAPSADDWRRHGRHGCRGRDGRRRRQLLRPARPGRDDPAGRRADGRAHRGRDARPRGSTSTSSAGTSGATSPRRSVAWQRRSRCRPATRSCGAASTSTCSAPRRKLKLVIPATLAIIFLLLYFNFRSVGETADRDALAAVRARRRDLVHLAPRLQLVGGGGDRVHRAGRRGGRDRASSC